MHNVLGSLTQRIAGSSLCACVPVNPAERAAPAARYFSQLSKLSIEMCFNIY